MLSMIERRLSGEIEAPSRDDAGLRGPIVAIGFATTDS